MSFIFWQNQTFGDCHLKKPFCFTAGRTEYLSYGTNFNLTFKNKMPFIFDKFKYLVIFRSVLW